MTNNNEIESLKAEIKSLLEIVNTNAEAKVSVEKKNLLTEIESLSTNLKQDFNVEDYKDSSLESLRYKAGILKDVFKMIAEKSDSGDLAGLVTRGAIDELSAVQIEDIVVDLIQLAFGLEPATDEIKEMIRLERAAEGYVLRR